MRTPLQVSSFIVTCTILIALHFVAASAHSQLQPDVSQRFDSPLSNRTDFGEAMAWGDFDDDGDLDLVVSADRSYFHYFKTDSGFSLGRLTLLTSGDVGSLASCDLDPNSPGDEIIIGRPEDAVTDPSGVGTHAMAGQVVVSRGGGSFLALWDQADAGGVIERRAGFGTKVLAGDFNGDNQCDIAISAPYKDRGGVPDVGSVHVFLGPLSTGGFVAPITQQPGGVPGPPQSDGQFGHTLLAADLYQSGHDQLVVSSPFWDVTEGMDTFDDAGKVWVVDFNANTGAFLQSTAQQITAADLSGVDLDDSALFGFSMASGDFVFTGKHLDLAIGIPGYSIGSTPFTGQVVVLDGQAGTVDTGFAWKLSMADDPNDGHGTFSLFGYSLAAGDVGGINADALVVGAPGDDGVGSVLVFDSLPRRYLTFSKTLERTALPGANQGLTEAVEFGSVLSFSGPTAKGTADLVIGVPQSPADSGRGDAPGALHWIPSVGRPTRNARIVLQAGTVLSGVLAGSPIQSVGPPRTNRLGEVAFWAETEAGSQAAVNEAGETFGLGSVNRKSVGISDAGIVSWINTAQGQVRFGDSTLLSGGDPRPDQGFFVVDPSDQLLSTGSGILYLVSSGALFKIDPAGNVQALVAPGDVFDTIADGITVTQVDDLAATHDGTSTIALVSTDFTRALIKDGAMIWLHAISGRGMSTYLIDTAMNGTKDLLSNTDFESLHLAAIRTSNGQLLTRGMDLTEGQPTVGSSVDLALNPAGELLAQWTVTPSDGNDDIAALYCLDTTVAPHIVLSGGDRLSFAPGAPASATLVRIRSLSEVTPQATAFVEAGILVDGEFIEKDAMLEVPVGGCGFFSDGFESGNTTAWN